MRLIRVMRGVVWLIITLITERKSVEGERKAEAWLMSQCDRENRLSSWDSLLNLEAHQLILSFFFWKPQKHKHNVCSVSFCFFNHTNNRVSNSIAATWFTSSYLLRGSYTWSMRQSAWLLGNGSPHSLYRKLPAKQALLSESLLTWQ